MYFNKHSGQKQYNNSPASTSQNMNYTVEHSLNHENADVLERENTEREPVYAGIVSAGSGSVSSTKIKKQLENKKRKIEYLNKAPAGSTYKASLTQYQRKYKFTPTNVISSSRGTKTSKPPLSTANGTIVSNSSSTYKYSRSRVDGLDSAGGYSSAASYNSIDKSEDQRRDPNMRSYMKNTTKTVASKLSATLPKSSVYK